MLRRLGPHPDLVRTLLTEVIAQELEATTCVDYIPGRPRIGIAQAGSRPQSPTVVMRGPPNATFRGQEEQGTVAPPGV